MQNNTGMSQGWFSGSADILLYHARYWINNIVQNILELSIVNENVE